MNRRIPFSHFIVLAVVFLTAGTILFAGCTSDDGSVTPTKTTQTEPKLVVYDGEESFQNRCAVCHGEFATGTVTGPPLVNRLYEIGHHPNFSFRNAVNNGVTAHHWNFGDMPPIPNVAPEEIDAIICHVRDLQRADGLPAGDPC
ncbi:MAG: cytochrome c [Chloroflexi bacterium]|nr:cytochrome c [Chloroflexota bacterium]